MPLITTGIPIISALGQSGGEFGQLPDYWKEQERKKLENELLKKKSQEFDAQLARDEEERAADARAGKAAIESMIPAEPGAPQMGPPAPPQQGVGPTGPMQTGVSSPLSHHDQEMQDLARNHIALARQIAPDYSKLSPQMKLIVGSKLQDAFKADHDEKLKNQLIEAAQNAGQLGSYGNPESAYSKSSVAHIVSLAQAGDFQGASEAMDKLSEPVFRRQVDEDNRKQKVANATGMVQTAKQFGLDTKGAEMLLMKYAGGIGSDAELDADLPQLVLGHAKASDGTWHVNQQAADQHDSMVTQLQRAKVAEAEANAKESQQRGEYYGAQIGPKGWMGAAMNFAQKLAAQGAKREEARAQMGTELYKAFGKRTDPAVIEKILDQFFPPASKRSLKRNPTGEALTKEPGAPKMSLSREGEEAGETAPDSEAAEGEAGAAPTLADKPEKVIAHLDSLPDDTQRLQWLQDQVKGKLGDKTQLDLGLDIMRSYGGGKLWTLYKSLKSKAKGEEK